MHLAFRFLACVTVMSFLICAPVAQGQVFTVLHSFGPQPDGAEPIAGVIQDAAGNLYGTTFEGGNNTACSQLRPPGCGSVFKIDTSGQETVLYSFPGAPNGAAPQWSLLSDPSGNLYGTVLNAGTFSNQCGGLCGVVFKLDATGTITALYSFSGGYDGALPNGPLIRDASGNLYGATGVGGGPGCGGMGCGVIFKIDPSGKESLLYSFTGASDGANPNGVIRDSNGNFYGAAASGGAFQLGTIFKIDNAGKETTLYSFPTGGAQGANPGASLFRDSLGNLYGTTEGGGPLSCLGTGCGVVFKVDPAGNETVLHSFTGPDGALPGFSGVIQDAAGNLYGTTYIGGPQTTSCPSGCGVVYRIDPKGNETVLYSFTGQADGEDPGSTLLLETPGDLVGTALFGGASGRGTVFKLAAPFLLSATPLSPGMVSAGGSAASSVSVTVNSGFSGNISLTCSVQPTPAMAPTCSVPLSITPGNPATLTVQTIAPSRAAFSSGFENGISLATYLPLIGLAMASVGLVSRQRRSRRMLMLPQMCLLLTVLMLHISCGGGASSGGGGGASTPAGSYSIIVTASSASTLSSSAVTTLTVQ